MSIAFMQDLIEEIKRHDLKVSWSDEGFAFKKAQEVIFVPWKQVENISMRSQIRYYGGFGLLSLLDFFQKIPLGYPMVKNMIVIRYNNGQGGVFEDELNSTPAKGLDFDSGVGYGLLKMAFEQASKDAISEDVLEFIRSKTTPTIERLKKRGVTQLFLIVGCISLVGIIAGVIIWLNHN